MNEKWIECSPGTLPLTLPTFATGGILWQANEAELLLDIPRQARFWVRCDHPILFERSTATTDHALHLWLQGLPLAAYFVQRQYLTLHAVALSTPRGAVVIAGHSAVGKTTLAAALACRGYPLLADEIVPLLPSPCGYLEVAPALPDLFLWRSAIAKLGFAVENCSVVRPGLERYALPPLPVADTPQPLAAIYLLGQSNEPQVVRKALIGHDRFLALQHYAFNRLLPESPSLRQQHFLQLTMLLSKVHIQRLSRPRDGWSIDELIAAIEDDLGL